MTPKASQQKQKSTRETFKSSQKKPTYYKQGKNNLNALISFRNNKDQKLGKQFFKVQEEIKNTYLFRILYSEKNSFKNGDEINIFSDKCKCEYLSPKDLHYKKS